MSISPWAASAVVPSPDGAKTARIADGHEVAMGAPTCGTLLLSTGLRVDACNPSMVWSDDSRFLAVPRWTWSRDQELVIIDTATGATRVVGEIYRVLELQSFRGGIVEGVDSPIHQPRRISIDVMKLAW